MEMTSNCSSPGTSHSHRFQGSLPETVVNSSCYLQILWLFENQFTGPLPALSLHRMTVLSDLEIHVNKFEGERCSFQSHTLPSLMTSQLLRSS
eukprot:1670323-Amphidinium_carterae.1